MVLAATPIVAPLIAAWIGWALLVVSLGVEVFAFVNCVFQRPDSFPVVGGIPKGGWLLMTGASVLVTAIFGFFGNSLLGFVAIIVALVYVLDTRPALREAADGGGW